MKLKDKVSLITGGASGIGEGITKKFCEEGAVVYICDINDETGKRAEEKYSQYGAKFLHLDVSSLDNWKQVVDNIMKEHGRIDVLVNNAGVSNTGTPMEDMDLQRDWYSLIDINLNGNFYGMYTVLPLMKKQKWGSVVNVASVAGLVAQCGVSGYTAAKGGIISLTRAAAVDYGKYFVRCNAICPTATVTPTVQNIFDTMPGVEEAMKAECVIPRLGKPEDIANAVAFAASDEASYLNGQIIAVDGGFIAK